MAALISLASSTCALDEMVGALVGARIFPPDGVSTVRCIVGNRVGVGVGRRVGEGVGRGVGRCVGSGVGSGAMVGQRNLGGGLAESRHTSRRIHE